MKFWQHLKYSLLRIFLLLFGILSILGLIYLFWSPGLTVRDGRHDLGTNGLWLQHGWLGDNGWFERNHKDKNLFRNPEKIKQLASRLQRHHIKYIFPHLCPCRPDGNLPAVDPIQTERFLDHFHDFQVLPWIGGILDEKCRPDSPDWRKQFLAAIRIFLQHHPRFAGVHLNIEPLPSGHTGFLTLLKELRQSLPKGKLISVAAYPPPTRWQPFPDIHWEEDYFRQVSALVDQMAVMMYDTGLRWPKPYQALMAAWTQEILAWSSAKVLLGLPAYEDAGVGYHDPAVENLKTSIPAIHAGLNRFATIPPNYQGIAIYCEWQMTDTKWADFKTEFIKSP